MVSVVKIESFDVNVTAIASQTHTLTNSVTLANAFVRRTTSIDKQSGPRLSTNDANANISCGAVYLSSSTQISFRQNSTTDQKIMGEVWRYTGAASGPDEFIVRGRYTITLAASSSTGSISVSGISNRDKCIPFFTGATYNGTSVNDYDSATVSVYIDASDNIQIERGATTGELVVYITVVEFTGDNWTVGHGLSLSHDTADETVTLNSASTGSGGTTFDVSSWSKATIIEASLEGDTAETGLSDNLGVWVPESLTATTQVKFKIHQDSSARNDGRSYCHVLCHNGFVVNRNENDNISEPNGAYATNATWPSGSSTTESLDELSLEWFSDTSGVGTAHARGRLSANITAATGTITYFVHRSGNTVRAVWGIIELANVDGTVKLRISDVDTDEVVSNSQANVVITGLGFGATQGTGKVELVEFGNYTGTKITQTSIDSWSDTSIQFDVSSGVLADTDCYLFVTNNSAAVGSMPVQVGNPPQTYQEAIELMNPNFYWTFQNKWDDEIGGEIANNSSGGTPGFTTSVKLAKGDTHSMRISGTDFVSPPDITGMNLVAQTRRYFGGWVLVDNISQILAVLYEEGAQVNNIAFLNGFGNNMMLQVADTGDDYVQAYVDAPLTPDRPYHVFFKLHGSAYDGEVLLYVDGVETVRTNGNPWTATNLDAHSGNISWGHEGTENLQVGDSSGVDNVDIAFASPDSCFYAHWPSFHGVTVSPTDIREVLFEKGAPAEVTISNDTTVNMQTSIDVKANTLFTDWPCSIEIGQSTDTIDFELTLDNITFEDRVSMQIRYMGIDNLTIVIKNGTTLDNNKLGAPYGGTIIIVPSVPLTVTVKDILTGANITGARVRMIADVGGPETIGYVLLEGLTDNNGDITGNYRYSSAQPVGGIVRKSSISPLYKTTVIAGEIGPTGVSLTIYMIRDE